MKKNIKFVYALIIIVLFAVGIFFIFQNIIIKQNSITNKNLINYQMVSGINLKYFYPLIVDYPNKIAMEKTNKILTGYFQDVGCNSGDPEDKNNFWNFTVNYAENDIFSVTNKFDFWCTNGAAHPAHGTSYITFDMKTGEEIPFEKLFTNYEKNKEQILNIVYVDMGVSADDNCSDVIFTDSNYSQNYVLDSKTKTIKVTPSLPYAIQACGDSATIPIQKLRVFFDMNSILNRI